MPGQKHGGWREGRPAVAKELMVTDITFQVPWGQVGPGFAECSALVSSKMAEKILSSRGPSPVTH